MVNADQIVENVTQQLKKWKEEGILQEKLKEYGLKFHDRKSPETPDSQIPLENET